LTQHQPAAPLPTIDEPFLIETLRRLVSINSINPSISAGGPGEAEIARATAEICREHAGLEVRVLESTPGRPSVLATLPGRGGGRSLMLNGHLDTVGVDGMDDPFTPRIEGSKMFGRGCYDMKAGVAASIAAAKALRDAGVELAGDLVIAAVADEEEGSLGTKEVIESVRTDGAIVTEPSWMRLALAHRGFAWIRVVVHGRQAHGSRHDLGVDANIQMARLLARVYEIERELMGSEGHRLAGRASLHVGLLEGGVGPTQYAPACGANIEWRMTPDQTPEGVCRRIRDIADALSRDDPSFKADVSIAMSEPAFEARPDSSLASVCAKTIGDVGGADPGPGAVWFWTDAALLQRAGIDTVVFGHDGGGEHETTEWVDLDSVSRLAVLLMKTAIDYCSASG